LKWRPYQADMLKINTLDVSHIILYHAAA